MYVQKKSSEAFVVVLSVGYCSGAVSSSCSCTDRVLRGRTSVREMVAVLITVVYRAVEDQVTPLKQYWLGGIARDWLLELLNIEDSGSRRQGTICKGQ